MRVKYGDDDVMNLTESVIEGREEAAFGQAMGSIKVKYNILETYWGIGAQEKLKIVLELANVANRVKTANVCWLLVTDRMPMRQ